MRYLVLIAAWAMFGLLHSLLASGRFKHVMQVAVKGKYKYYRPLYSLFATITLIAVLWYHASIPVTLLWQNSVAEKIIAAIISIPALLVMGISIKKYFFNLSGIDVFVNYKPAPALLEKGGLHKWMRHPLYTGTLLFVWCVVLWQPYVANIISASCITIYTRIGIYYEEKKLVKEFGQEYVEYAKKVPMLVPGF